MKSPTVKNELHSAKRALKNVCEELHQALETLSPHESPKIKVQHRLSTQRAEYSATRARNSELAEARVRLSAVSAEMITAVEGIEARVHHRKPPTAVRPNRGEATDGLPKKGLTVEGSRLSFAWDHLVETTTMQQTAKTAMKHAAMRWVYQSLTDGMAFWRSELQWKPQAKMRLAIAKWCQKTLHYAFQKWRKQGCDKGEDVASSGSGVDREVRGPPRLPRACSQLCDAKFAQERAPESDEHLTALKCLLIGSLGPLARWQC